MVVPTDGLSTETGHSRTSSRHVWMQGRPAGSDSQPSTSWQAAALASAHALELPRQQCQVLAVPACRRRAFPANTVEGQPRRVSGELLIAIQLAAGPDACARSTSPVDQRESRCRTLPRAPACDGMHTSVCLRSSRVKDTTELDLRYPAPRSAERVCSRPGASREAGACRAANLSQAAAPACIKDQERANCDRSARVAARAGRSAPDQTTACGPACMLKPRLRHLQSARKSARVPH